MYAITLAIAIGLKRVLSCKRCSAATVAVRPNCSNAQHSKLLIHFTSTTPTLLLCPLGPLMCPLGLPQNQQCALWFHLKTNIFLTATIFYVQVVQVAVKNMLVLRWNQRAHCWFWGRPKGHIRGTKGHSALWKRPRKFLRHCSCVYYNRTYGQISVCKSSCN